MAKFTNAGASIEGKKILLAGRKIISAGLPRRDQITGKLRFGVQIKRLGAAKIMVAFSPPAPRLNANSHTAKETVISGDQIFGSSYESFNVGKAKKGGAGKTHTHSGQEWTMSGDCFAEIEADWQKKPTSAILIDAKQSTTEPQKMLSATGDFTTPVTDVSACAVE